MIDKMNKNEGKNKYTYIILIFSMINWLPIIAYVFIYPPLSFSEILLLLSFISPVIAKICIITATILMLKKLSKVSLGSIIVLVNVIYLIWSKYYLNIMYHMT